jgi:hypothetical protein
MAPWRAAPVLVLLALVVSTVFAAPASAALVTYLTEGRFGEDAFASDSTLPVGAATLSFTGVDRLVSADPMTFVTLGTFSASGLGEGNFTGSTFDLRVTATLDEVQGQPSTLSAVLSGTITVGPPGPSSSLLVTFDDDTLSSAGVLFLLDRLAIPIPPPGADDTVAITATAILASAIPEPSGVLAAAVAAIGLLRRRRMARGHWLTGSGV